jgi:2'-5' RNA ligase
MGRLRFVVPSLLLALGACASQPVPQSAAPKRPVVLRVPAFDRNADMPFLSHKGPGDFDNALALNVRYQPIQELRVAIEKETGRRLDFLKSWSPQGEAHVTTITPPEFLKLKKHLTMEHIERIAAKRIQKADLEVLGIGSGRKEIDGQVEETFFVIVESKLLRQLRREIHRAYVKRGGSAGDWDPERFYPHVTIGYTKRDLHEQDGILKDLAHSKDTRFRLIAEP